MSDFPPADVLQKLGRTYRALLSTFDQAVGIPMPRWRILLALSICERVSQKQLARDLMMDPAALTRQIQAIEHKGFIVRETDPADKRIVHVALAPAGREMVAQALPQRTDFVRQVMQGLDEAQQRALEGMLDVLLDGLEQIRRNGHVAQRPE